MQESTQGNLAAGRAVCGAAAHHSLKRQVCSYALKGAKTTTELWPPKPKLLEMPAVMSCCCFTLATTSRPATSSMGSSCTHGMAGQ